MNRYIDAYEVKRQIQKATEGEVDVMKMFLKAMYRIDMIPPADVVEVVRCKHCKHIKEEHFNIMPDGYSCELSGLMVEQENYCSYGERADE